jgi:SAM-dependent methyltransferase
MTPDLWSIYLKLQTEMAYPPGSICVLKNEHAIMEAGDFYRSFVKKVETPNPHILLVGPAGVSEIEAVKRSTDGPMTVLTVHAMEAALYHEYRVVCADMHDTGLPNAYVDLIYAANVMEHAFAPYVALMELRRLLRPGGAAYYTIPSFAGVEGGVGPFHLHCLDAEVWRQLLHKTGYTVEDVVFHPAEAATNRTLPHYASFVCRAGEPPYPHGEILRAISAYRDGR